MLRALRRKPLLGTLVNRSHSISKDLVGSWVFNEGAGSTVSDSSGYGRHGVFQGGTGVPTWGITEIGAKLDFVQANTHRVELGDNFDLKGDQMTMVVWWTCIDVSGCGDRIFSKSFGSAAANHLWTLNVCNDFLRGRLKAGGTTVTVLDADHNIINNNLYMSAMTYDGADVRIYLSSDDSGAAGFSGGKIIEVQSASKTGNLDAGTTTSVMLGRNGDDTTQGNHLDGSIDQAYLWERALTLSELEILQDNPYIMFDYPYKGIYFSVTGVSDLSINVNDCQSIKESLV